MSGVLQSVSAVRIFVDDMERARHFYRHVLELDETSATPDWAVFDLDGKNIIVEKVAADDPEHDLVGRFLAVSFNVDDIDATYRKLVAKGCRSPSRRSGNSGAVRSPFPVIRTETF